MPNLRILKKIFEDLASKSKGLYRSEANPERLSQLGFSEMRQTGTRLHGGEPSGLFYANTPEDLGKLITGRRDTPRRTPNVTAYPLPGARSKTFSVEEWKKRYSQTPKEINAELKPQYDFVNIPDTMVGNPNVNMTVQLNPNKAIAKITHKGKDIYKILGLASALGIGANMVNPDESEAMPLGKLFKTGSELALKATKGPLSSAARQLEGMRVGDKTIKSVTKGSGEWRNIIYDNGDVQAATADYINSLAREVGKSTYLTKLATKGNEDRYAQAVIGLQNAWNRSETPSKALPELFHKQHVNRLNDLSASPEADMVLIHFGGKALTVMKEYADILKGKNITLPQKPWIKGVVRVNKTPLGE